MNKTNTIFKFYKVGLPLHKDGSVDYDFYKKNDIRFRLYDLVYKCTLFAYIAKGNSINKSYKYGSVYYENRISFLNETKKLLLKECEDLEEFKAPSEDQLSPINYENSFNRNYLDLIASIQQIVNVSRYILNTDRSVTIQDIEEVFGFFKYESADEFLKTFAIWKLGITKKKINEHVEYSSDLLAIPILHLNGYSITAGFTMNNDPIHLVSFDNNKQKYGYSILDFFSSITTNSTHSIDMYLHILASYSLATSNPQYLNNVIVIANNIKKLTAGGEYLINSMFRNILESKLSNNGLFNNNSQAKIMFLEFIAEAYNKNSCNIGPLTSKIVNHISSSKLSDTHKQIAYAILNINTSNDIGYEKLNSNSLEFVKPINISKPLSDMFSLLDFSKYSIEAIGKYTTNEENGESEDDDDVDKNPEKDGDENTDPNENEEEDNTDGEQDEDEITESILVTIPNKSYIFKLSQLSNAFDEYLYTLEIGNIITNILDNPPDTLTSKHKQILTQLMDNYIYLLDVESIKSIVGGIIKFESE